MADFVEISFAPASVLVNDLITLLVSSNVDTTVHLEVSGVSGDFSLNDFLVGPASESTREVQFAPDSPGVGLFSGTGADGIIWLPDPPNFVVTSPSPDADDIRYCRNRRLRRRRRKVQS